VRLDLSVAGASDALGDTVDHGALCGVAEQVVSTTRYALLEALAEHVAAAFLAVDGRVDAVTVSVRKLRPPVAQQLSTSGVRVTRER
jgi:dihydroneopterin aldolase